MKRKRLTCKAAIVAAWLHAVRQWKGTVQYSGLILTAVDIGRIQYLGNPHFAAGYGLTRKVPLGTPAMLPGRLCIMGPRCCM